MKVTGVREGTPTDLAKLMVRAWGISLSYAYSVVKEAEIRGLLVRGEDGLLRLPEDGGEEE
ncbi:MAG: hypothetical protein DRO06_03130 [Thermoproteota archaeon]|nr:MAG: hypothetical protein DRO06_03130 [Candidatus Korarchaeota archaeon]